MKVCVIPVIIHVKRKSVHQAGNDDRISAQLLQTPEFIYDQKIKLEQFAQRLAVNSTYLNRYFNQEYGCSFLQYLTSLRIEQAETLLKDSNAEIEDICYNTGFNSPSAFHKAFKNRYGYSPSEWRRRCLTEKLNAGVQ